MFTESVIMKHWFFILLFLLLTPLAAVTAQDMPLSLFLKPGESWNELPPTKPPVASPVAVTIPGLGSAVATVASPDGGTLYVAAKAGRHVWAFQIGKNGQPQNPAPYCPLRLKKSAESLMVTDLIVDIAGRIYAATPDGIQVFDPTGRLSGVLLLPEPGIPTRLGWEGEGRDLLIVWINRKKYGRVMNTSGLPGH